MRVDVYLTDNGYAKSRSAAQSLISAEAVIINGKKVVKPSEQIDENSANTVEITQTQKYVGRGGYKLEFALERFSVDVTDMTAVDVGASTGGFTDCLLQNGVKKVFAVDSGEGQLDSSLVSDPRVVNIEKYNARNMKKDDFDEKIDIAVMDVSFISQTLIIPSLASVLDDGAWLVSLIKPQFEYKRLQTVLELSGDFNGVIQRNEEKQKILNHVCLEIQDAGIILAAEPVESPITGTYGNTEYLVYLRRKEV